MIFSTEILAVLNCIKYIILDLTPPSLKGKGGLKTPLLVGEELGERSKCNYIEVQTAIVAACITVNIQQRSSIVQQKSKY